MKFPQRISCILGNSRKKHNPDKNMTQPESITYKEKRGSMAALLDRDHAA